MLRAPRVVVVAVAREACRSCAGPAQGSPGVDARRLVRWRQHNDFPTGMQSGDEDSAPSNTQKFVLHSSLYMLLIIARV